MIGPLSNGQIQNGSKQMRRRSPRSGSVRVDWSVCPNPDCSSRDMAYWNVDYKEDDFWCGTCESKIGKPIFTAHDKAECPMWLKTCPLSRHYKQPRER